MVVHFYDVPISDTQPVVKGLQTLFGMGRADAEAVCRIHGFGWSTWINELEPQEWFQLTQWIQNHCFVEKARKSDTRESIEHLMAIRCYRGLRHQKGYPVRGQRTHTNASRRRRTRAA